MQLSPQIHVSNLLWCLRIFSAVFLVIICSQGLCQTREDIVLAFFEAEIIYNRDQNPTLAIEKLDSLLKIDPSACRAYMVKGYCHKELLQYDEALTAFKASIDCEPNFYDNYIEMGDIYHKMGKLDSAEYCFHKALELEKQEPLPYYNLGVVYTSKDEYEKAIYFLNETIKIEPIYDVYYLRANAYFLIGEYDLAYEDLEIFFQTYPSDQRAFFLKGEILNALGQFRRSILALEMYLVDPVLRGEDYVAFLLGDNYRKLNEMKKSCFYAKKAKSLGYVSDELNILLKECSP